ncbi:heme ABC exporter ATP-binding protein CcmA [Segnochrobactraceae bacterium EtOH-i3]
MTAAGSITALSGTALGCIRGGRRLFAGLDFHLPAGSALVLTGRNGAGKTSLLRVVAGLQQAAEGGVRLHGAPADEPVASYLHFISHLDAIKAAATVHETLNFWAAWLGTGPGAAAAPLPPTGIDDALDRLGLGDLADLPAGHLSAGQRRRLALARLLVAPRPLWLADEPTAALDRAGEALFGTLVAEHLAAGGLLMAATHQPLPVADTLGLEIGRRAAPVGEDEIPGEEETR